MFEIDPLAAQKGLFHVTKWFVMWNDSFCVCVIEPQFALDTPTIPKPFRKGMRKARKKASAESLVITVVAGYSPKKQYLEPQFAHAPSAILKPFRKGVRKAREKASAESLVITVVAGYSPKNNI